MKNRGGDEAGVTIFRFQTLDILRFLAASGVILFHIDGSTGNWTTKLYLCVDLFFVLSGFVLAPTYPKHRDYREMSKFILRRFVRLAPMVYSTLFFSITYFLLIELKNVLNVGEEGKNIDLSIFSIFLSLLLFQIFSNQALLLNYPMWSLSSEWIINILLLFPLSSKTRKTNTTFFLIFGLTTQVVNLIFKQPEILVQLSRCLTGVSAGILLRFLFESKKFHLSFKAYSMLCLFLTLSALVVLNSSMYVAPMISIIPFLILVFFLASIEQSINLRCPKLISYWAGVLSFGMYAWHVPLGGVVETFVPKYFQSTIFMSALILIIFSCIAGFVVTKLVERPAQNYIQRVIK